MTDPRIAALAEALHDTDETCNAHHYLPFEECATKEWDESQAVEVLSRLRALGWAVTRDPAGTVPLGLDR
jgi:hypothetical protein